MQDNKTNLKKIIKRIIKNKNMNTATGKDKAKQM